MFSKRDFLFVVLGIIFIFLFGFNDKLDNEKFGNLTQENNLKEKITYGLAIIDKILNANNLFHTVHY